MSLAPIPKRFKIATSEQESFPTTISNAIEWIVSLDDLCKSDIEEYAKYTELLSWFFEASRFSSCNLPGKPTYGAIKNSDLILFLPNGEHGPKIEQQLYSGKYITKAVIIRLRWVGGKKQVIQKITFNNLRIIEFQQNIQYITAFFQIKDKESDIETFSLEDGTSLGHKVSNLKFDST
ncbi:MAG: hypothetical protein LBS83_03535 [Holosporales bacterium]|nr:hypothetical protein [Holosporales bacterium]